MKKSEKNYKILLNKYSGKDETPVNWNNYTTKELEDILIDECYMLIIHELEYIDHYLIEPPPEVLLLQDIFSERKDRLNDIFEYSPENLKHLNKLHGYILDTFTQMHTECEKMTKELDEKRNSSDSLLHGYDLFGYIYPTIQFYNKKPNKRESDLTDILNRVIDCELHGNIISHEDDGYYWIIDSEIEHLQDTGIDYFKDNSGIFKFISLTDVLKINSLSFKFKVDCYCTPILKT